MKKEKIVVENNKTLVMARQFTSLSITPNGQTIVGLTFDGYVYIWNVPSGELEALFRIQEREDYLGMRIRHYLKCSKMNISSCGSFVIILKISPTSEYILIDLEKKEFKRKSVPKYMNGNEIDIFSRKSSLSVVISRNDDFLLVAFNHQVKQLFFTKNKTLSFVEFKEKKVSSLAINSKNYYLAIGLKEGSIFLYSFQPKREIWKIEKAHSEKIVGLCFTNDTKYIISAGEEGEIKVWDFLTAKYLYSLYSSSGKVRALNLTANGIFLVISLEKKIVIFNLDTKEEKEIAKTTQHLQYPLMVALNDKQLVLHSIQDGIQIYDLEKALLKKSFSNLFYSYNNLKGLRLGCGSNDSVAINPLEISADSKYVVSILSYQQIILWNIDDKRVETKILEDEEVIGKVTITPNNEYVISSTINLFDKNDFFATINIYDVESSLKIASFRILEKYLHVVLLRVTLDNKYLIVIIEGGTYIKFDLESLEYVENKKISCHEYDTFAHTISLDGSLIAYGMKENYENTLETIEIYDIVKDKRVKNIKYFINNASGYFYTIVISKDNRYIELYADNKKLFCWDRDKELFLYKIDFRNGSIYKRKTIICSKIAPNKHYSINLYEDANKGLVLYDLEKREKVGRLMAFENEESLFLKRI